MAWQFYHIKSPYNCVLTCGFSLITLFINCIIFSSREPVKGVSGTLVQRVSSSRIQGTQPSH